jgi:acetylornithine/N-succinyldiaminopimelate aminotransferase
MEKWRNRFPETITDIRGTGLLLLIEFKDEKTAGKISEECLKRHLFVRQTQGNGIRIFPALNVEENDLKEGLAIFQEAIETVIQ